MWEGRGGVEGGLKGWNDSPERLKESSGLWAERAPSAHAADLPIMQRVAGCRILATHALVIEMVKDIGGVKEERRRPNV